MDSLLRSSSCSPPPDSSLLPALAGGGLHQGGERPPGQGHPGPQPKYQAHVNMTIFVPLRWQRSSLSWRNPCRSTPRQPWRYLSPTINYSTCHHRSPSSPPGRQWRRPVLRRWVFALPQEECCGPAAGEVGGGMWRYSGNTDIAITWCLQGDPGQADGGGQAEGRDEWS